MSTYNFDNFKDKSIEEIVHEFVVERGDLTEESTRKFFLALMEFKVTQIYGKTSTKTCSFVRSWIGKCQKPVNGGDFCTVHSGIKCVVCDKQADHDCPETFQFVCGAPLCADHNHIGSGRYWAHA